jgi:ubiquinone/menaquinone biosynthesis C-methylase UbiE
MMSDRQSARMRETWDTLARMNAMHYIATGRKDWDRGEFLQSGRDMVRTLLQTVKHRPAGVALELGCGIGRLSLALAEEFDHVHGIDVSEEMIRQANQLKRDLGYTNIEFHCNNGSDFAFIPTNSCDFGLCYIVLQHLPDKRIVLGYIRELARVVKPGGHLLFQVPVYRAGFMTSPWRAFQYLFRSGLILLETTGMIAPDKRLAFRGTRVTMDELSETLAPAGLETLSMQRTRSLYRFCDDVIVYAVRRGRVAPSASVTPDTPS